MKKLILTSIFALACTSVFAEFSYRFYNKLSTDTMTIRHVDDDYLRTGIDFKKNKNHSYTDADFLGVNNRVYAEVKTDKTDAMVKATIGFGDFTGDNDYGFKWTGNIDDWYVEYRPWNFFTLGFHDSIYMDGSYLPIYDDNLYSGNIGSEGVTVVYSPSALNGALRIAATVPFTDKGNWLFADEDDAGVDDDTFDVGIGAIYTVELFQVGATFQDIFDNDERRFGVYVNLPSFLGLVKNLTVGGGFAHSEGDFVYNFDRQGTFDDYTYFGGVNGENLFSSYLTYTSDIVVNAELVWNLNDKDFYSLWWHDDETLAGWDLYTAASVQFWLSKPLSAVVVGKFLADTAHRSGESLKNVYGGEFQLLYELSQHSEIKISAEVDYFDKNYKICFPCYWKYTF